MIQAVISDFGGVLTTPLEASFRYWSEESGVPLEDLGAALQRLAERDGAHPLHLKPHISEVGAAQKPGQQSERKKCDGGGT